MSVISNIVNFFLKQTPISFSKVTPVYTKYGLFQIKAYISENQEYLAIMSHHFFNVSSHIVYIHTDTYAHTHVQEDHGCYCDNQLEIILKMMRKEGGVALYSSQNKNSIDGLLKELNVRKLEAHENKTTRSKINLKLDAYGQAYQTLGFIFSDLGLKKIHLVASDTQVMDAAKHLKIDVLKNIAAIGIQYGDDK